MDNGKNRQVIIKNNSASPKLLQKEQCTAAALSHTPGAIKMSDERKTALCRRWGYVDTAAVGGCQLGERHKAQLVQCIHRTESDHFK